METDQIVDMTPTYIHRTYGHYRFPGGLPTHQAANDPRVWPRIQSRRLRVSDLTTWMASANIARDGLADASLYPNEPDAVPTGNSGLPEPEGEAPSPGPRLRRSDHESAEQ